MNALERPVLRSLDAAKRRAVKWLAAVSKISNYKCGYQNSLCGLVN